MFLEGQFTTETGRERFEMVQKSCRNHDCVYKSTLASHSKMGKDGESFEFAFLFLVRQRMGFLMKKRRLKAQSICILRA